MYVCGLVLVSVSVKKQITNRMAGFVVVTALLVVIGVSSKRAFVHQHCQFILPTNTGEVS